MLLIISGIFACEYAIFQNRLAAQFVGPAVPGTAKTSPENGILHAKQLGSQSVLVLENQHSVRHSRTYVREITPASR